IKTKTKEIYLKSLTAILTKWVVKIVNMTKMMARIGCSRTMKYLPRTPTTFSALHLTDDKFFTCLRNISVSIHSLQKKTENGVPTRSAATPYMRCTTFASYGGSARSGGIYGHAGIRRRCGRYGLDQPRLISPAY